MVSCRDLW